MGITAIKTKTQRVQGCCKRHPVARVTSGPNKNRSIPGATLSPWPLPASLTVRDNNFRKASKTETLSSRIRTLSLLLLLLSLSPASIDCCGLSDVSIPSSPIQADGPLPSDQLSASDLTSARHDRAPANLKLSQIYRQLSSLHQQPSIHIHCTYLVKRHISQWPPHSRAHCPLT